MNQRGHLQFVSLGQCKADNQFEQFFNLPSEFLRRITSPITGSKRRLIEHELTGFDAFEIHLGVPPMIIRNSIRRFPQSSF